MYKVLVAETDLKTIDTVTQLIEEKFHNAKVVSVAHSGNDAVIDAINNEPDLILIAIKIAGMNGIETIRKIRRFNKSVHIIIISEYDYFEFAREAMTLHVNDYLLKPLNTSELKNAIERELLAVKEENDKERKYKKEESQFNNALRLVEQHFIYSVSYNMKVEHEMEEYQKLIGIGMQGYMMGIVIAPVLLTRNWDMEKATNRIYRRVKDIISQRAICAIGPRILNRFVVYVTTAKDRDGKEEQIEAMRLAKEVVKGLKDTFDIDVKISIGSIRPIQNIHESYVEMIRSSTYDLDTQIVYYKDIRHKSLIKENHFEMVEQLIETIKYDKVAAEEAFKKVIEIMRPLSSVDRITHLFELFSVLSYTFRKELKNQDTQGACVEQSDRMLSMTLQEQENWACTRFHNFLKLMKSAKSVRKSTVVTAAMEYIQKHYNEEITLNDISDYVNLSPQHFSKIFKETTNFNYVEWVNNLRITKAKEYMSQDEYTIKEICYLVGFQDPNYFSRIFKKYVGITPSEYMKEQSI